MIYLLKKNWPKQNCWKLHVLWRDYDTDRYVFVPGRILSERVIYYFSGPLILKKNEKYSELTQDQKKTQNLYLIIFTNFD